MSNKVLSLPKNLYGTDYYVPDIHGCFSVLDDLMAKAGFNPSVDRLIAGGDMVDRGPESGRILQFLALPYVYSLIGNHEVFCINSGIHGASDGHKIHGGIWWQRLDIESREKIINSFKELPFAIELHMPDGSKYGFVHAEVWGHDWNAMVERLHNLDGWLDQDLEAMLLWSKNKHASKNTALVENIDKVFVGHVVVQEPITLGNTRYMDTGAGFSNGHLTLLNLMTMKEIKSQSVDSYYMY